MVKDGFIKDIKRIKAEEYLITKTVINERKSPYSCPLGGDVTLGRVNVESHGRKFTGNDTTCLRKDVPKEHLENVCSGECLRHGIVNITVYKSKVLAGKVPSNFRRRVASYRREMNIAEGIDLNRLRIDERVDSIGDDLVAILEGGGDGGEKFREFMEEFGTGLKDTGVIYDFDVSLTRNGVTNLKGEGVIEVSLQGEIVKDRGDYLIVDTQNSEENKMRKKAAKEGKTLPSGVRGFSAFLINGGTLSVLSTKRDAILYDPKEVFELVYTAAVLQRVAQGIDKPKDILT